MPYLCTPPYNHPRNIHKHAHYVSVHVYKVHDDHIILIICALLKKVLAISMPAINPCIADTSPNPPNNLNGSAGDGVGSYLDPGANHEIRIW